jgi:hypothetical protein
MPVPIRSISVGKFYRRFSEVWEVIAIDPNGHVTFKSRGKSEGGQPTESITYGRAKERFAREVDDEAGPDYAPP